MLEISVLGPVEVARDGRPVPVPGGKTAELLVRLAIEAGTTVSAERLADDLWAGAATQRNTLQSKVARLRRALGDAAAIAGAYRLEVDPGRVDALCVLREASAASRRARAQRRGACSLPWRAAPGAGRPSRPPPAAARRGSGRARCR